MIRAITLQYSARLWLQATVSIKKRDTRCSNNVAMAVCMAMIG